MLPPVLTLHGRDFERVCVRRSGVAVYHAPDAYLRIGVGLESELATHRQMLGHDFPVAALLDEGVHDGLPYFVEASLGPCTLGDLFAKEWEALGGVSVPSLTTFISVIGLHARAQAAMLTPHWSGTAFAELVGVEAAATLLPGLAPEIRSVFHDASQRLATLPGTLLHGDLHPYNMCAGGVIDLEGAGWGPLGYDVVTAALTPRQDGDRAGDPPTGSWLAPHQLERHLESLDEVFETAGCRPTAHRDALVVCRAVSWCSRRHPDPGVWSSREHTLRAALAAYRAGRTPVPDRNST